MGDLALQTFHCRGQRCNRDRAELPLAQRLAIFKVVLHVHQCGLAV